MTGDRASAGIIYLWRGPTQLRGLPLSPNSQALDLPSVEGRTALSQLRERRQLARRSNRASGESFPPNGAGPRAPGRRNFVTFVSRDTWSEVDLASCHRPSVWDCAPILRAALVQGSSSNLPNGRRHFGQPRTCSPPTPCVPFAEEFQPYTKSRSNHAQPPTSVCGGTAGQASASERPGNRYALQYFYTILRSR